MKTIKLSRDEEQILREAIKIAKNQTLIPVDQKYLDSLKEMGLKPCPQCDEIAWDERICHICGLKNI
jgi:uncharacterized protein (UPF0212 family)